MWTAEKDMKTDMIDQCSETTYKQLWNWSLKEIQAWTEFEPKTSAIPVQCSGLYFFQVLFHNCLRCVQNRDD